MGERKRAGGHPVVFAERLKLLVGIFHGVGTIGGGIKVAHLDQGILAGIRGDAGLKQTVAQIVGVLALMDHGINALLLDLGRELCEFLPVGGRGPTVLLGHAGVVVIAPRAI